MESIRMNEHLPSDWRVLDSPQMVAQKALQVILHAADEAITQRGAFHFVTAGGTTPLQVYKRLKAFETTSAGQAMDWSKWHLYLGDERCLPVDDPERNSRVLTEAWLGDSAIPMQNRHFMDAEKGPETAARLYEKVVEGIRFDLVLLGMGEDGHTASLFPGHQHPGEENRAVQTETRSPKPPSERVTLSARALANSRCLIKLITGSSKRQALAQWLNGEALPISAIRGEQTQTLVSREALPKGIEAVKSG